MASFTYFAMGEIRSWSSSGIPSLQGKDGRNATLSQGPLPVEVVSWISKSDRFVSNLFSFDCHETHQLCAFIPFTNFVNYVSSQADGVIRFGAFLEA